MTYDSKEKDREKGDAVLRCMLETPPKPGKPRTSEANHYKKLGGNPAKNDRPEKS